MALVTGVTTLILDQKVKGQGYKVVLNSTQTRNSF